MKTLTTAALTATAAAIGMTAAVAGIGVGALLGACICNRGQVRARDSEQANGSQPKPAAADAPPTVGA